LGPQNVPFHVGWVRSAGQGGGGGAGEERISHGISPGHATEWAVVEGTENVVVVVLDAAV
jgi:hypothetical protein